MTEAQKPRWWMLAVIVGLALLAEIIVWFVYSDDTMQQGIGLTTVVLVAGALLFIWWLFLSRLPWKTRLAGLGVLALLAVGFFSLFRFEGLSGAFVPQYGWRFGSGGESATAQSGARSASPSGSGGRLEIAAADWPGFRGPQRDSLALREVVRTDWNDNPPKEQWRRPVGPSWSSFVAVGDYLFTQEQRGDDEVVVAWRAADGEEIWAHSNTARHETFLGGTGPRATPTLFDSRLYALGATGRLDCLDPLTGSLHWTRDIAADAGAKIPEYGYSGSPLVFGDVVVVNSGGPEGRAVTAYDRLSGEIAWQGGSRKAGYAAPRLETIGGEPQILMYSAIGLGGHDPTTGEELWWYEWKNGYANNSIQPILTADGGVFISTEQTGSALVDPRRNGDGWTVTPRWERENQFKLRYNGGVLKDNHVYGLDGGILACFALDEGKRCWKKGRFRFGQILLLRDHLLVLSENGDVVLLDISPEGMEEIARFHAIDGRCWNHPVVREGILYVRSDEEAASFDLRP
ncbi:MAG: PQQ-binding-like beta-propeller repeat protein [Acidobacteriota bacterium]